jgi:hypothetical protein
MASTVGLMLLAGGCQWEVDPQGSPQGLAEGQPACEYVSPLQGAPRCGVPFEANVRGECNDCTDVGCQREEEGLHDCVCHEEGELCFEQEEILLPDGGTQAPLFCAYRGRSCDCNDGKGPVYGCECEGGGDDCHCQVWTEPFFLYDQECR